MPKAVAEIGIGAGLIGANFLLPGLGVALTGTMSSILASAGSGFVMEGIGTLLAQRGRGVSTTSRNPLAPWQIIYGRTRVGGTVVYQQEVGSVNRILLLVVAVANHPCQQIEQVIFNNKRLPFRTNTEFTDESNPQGFKQSYFFAQFNRQIETISRTNNIVSVTFTQDPSAVFAFQGQTVGIQNSRDAAGVPFDGFYPVVQTGPNSFTYASGGAQGPGSGHPGTIVSTYPDYAGTVTVGYYLGNQTQPSGIILGNANGYWTDQHILKGITYVALKLEYDKNIYSGLPEISFVVRGKNDIYDPRTKTTGYTNNAALCISDYLTQPVWGYRADYTTRIDEPQLIAAANICDTPSPLALGGTEPMYCCDGAFDVSVTPGDVLSNMLTSCGGRLVYIGGKFQIFPAAWITPSGAIEIGAGNTGPLMMCNSDGLVPEYFNNPSGAYIPDCAGTTESQFVYALGLLAGYQATGNSNAKALADRILGAVIPYLFRGLQPPSRVTASNAWSPNSFFNVKQPFNAENAELINVDDDFATDLAGDWRQLAALELQTNGDAYNWAIRLFGAAALVYDGVTPGGNPNLGFGNNPFGAYPFGDPEVPDTTQNSGWLLARNAILQMAALAYSIRYSTVSGNNVTLLTPLYSGGMIPFLVQCNSNGSTPALKNFLGPAYTGMQSPWAIGQVNPANVATAVGFLLQAQAQYSNQGTNADTVVFTVTGPNAGTHTTTIDINSAGNATAQLSYAGLNPGTDTIVASLPSHSLTSNAAAFAWSAYNVPFGVVSARMDVMAADGSSLFNGATAVLSTQPVPGLMFNAHPREIFPGDPHQSGNQASPFVCNMVGSNGEYEGDQYINNTSGRFNAVITGKFTISAAGTVNFRAYVNSAFVIGVQNATWVSGMQSFGALAAGTATKHYPTLAGLNGAGDWPGGNWAEVPFSLDFPAPGLYEFEIDYASGLYSEREFCLKIADGATVIPNIPVANAGTATATGTAPSGQLQLTPYSGGGAIGQTATFTLQLSGITYASLGTGPFAPVFNYEQPATNPSWGDPNSWGWTGPDPNTTAGYFQYRPLAELADLIAAAAGTESWYTTAVTITSNLLAWTAARWTTAAAGPPNYFPQHGASTTAPDVHCAALILYAVMSLDLAARPTGSGTMDTTQHTLLTQAYAMYQALYLTSGPMAGTFCTDPGGAQDWSPIWAGEILRALSLLVKWATINNQAATKAQAIVWINGLIESGLEAVVPVNPNLGYTADDYRGGPIWKPNLARTELFNGVKGTYVSEANQWQQSDFPSYAQDAIHGYTNGTPAHNCDANWDADGERRWKDVQLPFTTSVSAAQRLASIELRRCRQQGRGSLQGMMTVYPTTPLDTIYVSFKPFGWLNKVVEAANTRLVQWKEPLDDGKLYVVLLGTELDIQETGPTIYEWDVREELSAQGYSYIPGLTNLPPD